MNIAVVDDIENDRNLIVQLLKEYSAVSRIHMDITEFESAEELLDNFRSYSFGFIFLDIYMNGLSGVDAARIIREKDPDIVIIFLTTSDEHMPEAFSVHAYDYIGKPADKERVFTVMNECIQSRFSNTNEPHLTFVSERTQISLPYNSTKMIRTSNANYLEITDKNGDTYETRMTFSSISDTLLSDNRFLLVIRGILINMDYVRDIHNGICVLEGNISLPINVKKSKELEDTWQNYKFAKIRSRRKLRRLL